MATSAWRGFISFGLISVPIRLFTAARSSHVAFHEIHKECGTRVHQQMYCPYHKRVVSRDEIAMGYEIDEDKYVLVDPTELKKMQPKSSSAMEITQFVKLTDVDPMYFETSYFVIPEEAGQRAYTLLYKTMKNLDYAAIAQVTMHQREQVVILRPYEDGLALHTMYYPAEIHEVKEYGKNAGKDLKKEEIKLGEQFAQGLLKPFRPEEFHDEYQERVKQLIESKSKGKVGPKEEAPRKLAPVIDLMSALKQSLNENRSMAKTKSKKRRTAA